MARIYFSNSSTGNTTNNTTTYNNKVSVTFDPTSGKRYAIFWSAMLSHGANNSDARVRLQKTTDGAVTFQLFNIEPEQTVDRMAVNDVSVWTADVSTSTTIAVQFSAEGSTTTISDAYINVLELFDDEQVSTTEADASTTTNTYSNLNTVTVPAGDWFIIGALAMSTPATNQPTNSIDVRIFDETNAVELTARSQYFSADTTNFTPYFAAGAVSPTASTTYALQFLENSNATLTVRYRTIIALNRANFAQSFAAQDQTTTTTTSNAYQTKLTLSETLGPGEIGLSRDYLVLMFWTTETNSTTVDVFSTVTESDTDLYSDTGRQPRRDASDIDDQFAQGWTETFLGTPGTLATFDIDFRSQTSGTTVRIQDAVILLMNLVDDPAPPPAAVGYSFGFILL
jgi:hypothetical protein